MPQQESEPQRQSREAAESQPREVVESQSQSREVVGKSRRSVANPLLAHSFSRLCPPRPRSPCLISRSSLHQAAMICGDTEAVSTQTAERIT